MWTEMQSDIIHKRSGDTVVVASPGSGKTTVLTEHIVHQLRHNAVDPRRVMLITYTREAARELRRRLAQGTSLNENALLALRIGTFHSEAFRMLLQAHVAVPPVLGAAEQYRLLRALLREEGQAQPVQLTTLAQLITRSKSTWPPGSVPKKYRRIIAKYEKVKRRLSRWDYDDILQVFCQRMEHPVPDTMAVDYLLVDEFQDTNQLQWSIVGLFQRIWSSRLFVVGDDDQSIYAFRGASPKWLREASIQKGVKTFLLTRNFRSDRQVIGSATNLILHNRNRIEKPFEAESLNEGRCVCTTFSDELSEAAGTRTLLANIFAAHREWQVAVLARTRKQLLPAWTHGSSLTNQGNVDWQTFHGAKGKEWDAVIVVGAVQANPYLREPSDDTEEERRLFYVAVTRAKHSLWICSPRRIAGANMLQSQFVAESCVTAVSESVWISIVH